MHQQQAHVRLVCKTILSGPSVGGYLQQLADVQAGVPSGHWTARLAQSSVSALLLFDERLASIRQQLTVEEQATLLQQLVTKEELQVPGCSVGFYTSMYDPTLLRHHWFATVALKGDMQPQLVSIPPAGLCLQANQHHTLRYPTHATCRTHQSPCHTRRTSSASPAPATRSTQSSWMLG
jgi:hypothetical protein